MEATVDPWKLGEYGDQKREHNHPGEGSSGRQGGEGVPSPDEQGDGSDEESSGECEGSGAGQEQRGLRADGDEEGVQRPQILMREAVEGLEFAGVEGGGVGEFGLRGKDA